MADTVVIEKPVVLDILTNDEPALSSTSDVPIVETKPDASNEGAPPSQAEPITIEGEATEVVEEAEQQGESATPSTEEQSGQPTGDKPRGVGKALAELRAANKAADARAKAAEERLEQALRTMEQLSVKPAPEPEAPDEPVRPTRDAYVDPDAYDAALIDFAKSEARAEVAKARAEDVQKSETERIQKQMTEAHELYTKRVETAKSKYADFDEVAKRSDVTVPQAVVHAIINDERGPDIQYYFGQHPEEAKRLMTLTPASQLIELGRITAKLDMPVVKPAVSAAPKPITPVKGAGNQERPNPETMSMEEYASYRRQEAGMADPQAKNKMGMARSRH